MRTKLLVLALMLMTCFSAKAGGLIVYSAGETCSKVADLPKTEEYNLTCDDGKEHHANLGVMFKQFSIFWIPLFNYGDYKYVLLTEDIVGKYDYTYAELDADDMAYIRSQVSGIPEKPELPFWDKIGGKLVALLIIAGLYLWSQKKKKEQEEEAQAQATAENPAETPAEAPAEAQEETK